MRVVAVGEAPDVVHADELEDVVEADAELHVGTAAHEVGVRGEGVEVGVVGEEGVVLIRERAVPAAKGNNLAQLQALEERQAVEQRAIREVGGFPRDEAVVDELHRVH